MRKKSKASKKKDAKNLVLISELRQIPHPEKQEKKGEDAAFISRNGHCIGVFDGVGEWASRGVNPREYAEKLSQCAKEAVDELHMCDPLAIMKYAHIEASSITGTSTACIAFLANDCNFVFGCNLGDSGFMVIRNKDTILRTKEQQVKFNVPFQMGTSSDIIPGTHADIYKVHVQPGDIIIMGTDGFFDNLSNKSICNVVQKTKHGKHLDCVKLANALAQKAFDNSQNRIVSTPFSMAAKKANIKWNGGKTDDITVIVSLVSSIQ